MPSDILSPLPLDLGIVMFDKVARVGLAAMLAVAATVTGGGPANAAGKPGCAIGRWKLLGEEYDGRGVSRGEAWWEKISGAGGIRLTVSASSASYDFTGSAKDHIRGSQVDGAYEYAYWNRYTGKMKLKLKLKYTSGTRGAWTVYGRTATGNATVDGARTKPKKKKFPRYSLVKDFRNGGRDSLVPAGASFACSAKKLKITQVSSGKGQGDSWKESWKLTYTRL